MPDTIIDNVIAGKLDLNYLIKWLNDDKLEGIPEDCVLFCNNRSEFVAYFLSYLRNQTDSILQTNNNALQIRQRTPDKVLSSRRKHRRSISDPTSDDRTMDSLTVRTDRRSHESPSKDRKRGRKVKTKLFTEEKTNTSSDESRNSIGMEKIVISSTPMKNGGSFVMPQASPVTRISSERCDTRRLRHKDKNVSLGDYIVTAQKSNKKRKSRNVSNEENDSKVDLDISNSEVFPEIGARKASSLRSEKRRIKPTNLDGTMAQKSFSLNSFNSECFQQPSPLALEDNLVFQNQKLQPKELANSFDVERNILKQERHKLMEKFHLNASASVPVTPQIKIIQKDFLDNCQNYIKADFSKVVYKEKIDMLVEIYDVLLKNNLILSINTEIYFLISILLSKQIEDEYNEVDSKMSENNTDCLLKSIHNSTYFAIKSLWNLRTVLEVILDKNSLKIFGDNKRVRGFYPDLAKFLLNSYGLKCEAENLEKPRPMDKRCSSGVVCFNFETDNAENFPSILSFQNFKKQRDMFYEILRWYTETQSTGVPRTTLRARIKTLLSCGQTPSNHAHLAALFTHHMIAECLPPNAQESKLSKLQRRLTCPTSDSHRLPQFTDKEMFYKEFITSTENELFRVHLRDAMASELTLLDGTSLVNDDRNSNADICKEFLQLEKKLCLLGKFLGFLTSLPYTQLSIDMNKNALVLRNGQREENVPKEKVLENNLLLRNYSQPAMDLKGILTGALQNNRLCVTLPWIVHFLSMLDYSTLRIKYYQELIKTLFNIYVKLLTENRFKKNTLIFLKSNLGWLFDLPYFPQEFFYDKYVQIELEPELNVDSFDVIDEITLFELCPYLREVNILLSTCKVGQKDGSFRHITPVSLSLKTEDRVKNKERELQIRLEEELIKSQPSSTRRVLELVTDRVTSAIVRELAAGALNAARSKARECAKKLVKERVGDDSTTLLQSLQNLYSEQLNQLRSNAIPTSVIQQRVTSALTSLLPNAPNALHVVAARGCCRRLKKWIGDNWGSTTILCKDIEAEMHNLIAIGDFTPRPSDVNVDAMTLPAAVFDANHVSVAGAIIGLKEQVCLLLEYEDPINLSATLTICSTACMATNLFARIHTTRALLQLSVDLCVVYVSRKPKEVNDTFLNQLHSIWNICCPDRQPNQSLEPDLPERRGELSPELRNFDDDRAPTPITSDDDESHIDVKKLLSNVRINKSDNNISLSKLKSDLHDLSICGTKLQSSKSPSKNLNKSKNESNISAISAVDAESSELLECFDRILCPRNIVLLNTSKCKATDVWEAMATVLVFLLKFNYLSEDSLTEQCLAVYRQDWSQNILESLSTCMKSVSSRWSRSSNGKFTLFLDFLAEFCGDMDMSYEPLE